MTKPCENCGAECPESAKFCGRCGFPFGKRMNQQSPGILHMLVQSSAIIVIAIVLANTVYSVVNFNDLYEGARNEEYSVTISAGVADWVLFKFTDVAVGVDLAALLLIEALCLAYAVYRYVTPLKKEFKGESIDATDKTGLGAASTCLAASLFIGGAYLIITAMIGHGVDASWMGELSDETLSFMLTRAGVREELMFRVLWIGAPMMILAAVLLKDRKCWHYLFGGFGMSKAAYVLIFISAVVFGLAHNSGWGFSKVIEAGMAGIIFAYLYVEYGLYAAILAHTANDTVSSLASLGLGAFETLFVLSLIGIGLLTIIYWVKKPNIQVIDPRKMKWFPEKIEGTVMDLWKRH